MVKALVSRVEARLGMALRRAGAAMVRHSDGVFYRVKGPSTDRVREIGDRARGFVEVMRSAGARDEELATVLIAIIEELEKEANAARRKRHSWYQEETKAADRAPTPKG